MNKLDNLFIRACKSKDAWTRVQSVYRRYYYYKVDKAAITSILLRLCEQYAPIPPKTLIDDLHPGNQWKFESTDYYEKCCMILINNFRYLEVNKLPDDYIKPQRFR